MQRCSRLRPIGASWHSAPDLAYEHTQWWERVGFDLSEPKGAQADAVTQLQQWGAQLRYVSSVYSWELARVALRRRAGTS